VSVVEAVAAGPRAYGEDGEVVVRLDPARVADGEEIALRRRRQGGQLVAIPELRGRGFVAIERAQPSHGAAPAEPDQYPIVPALVAVQREPEDDAVAMDGETGHAGDHPAAEPPVRHRDRSLPGDLAPGVDAGDEGPAAAGEAPDDGPAGPVEGERRPCGGA
jgi:hypothetical protein